MADVIHLNLSCMFVRFSVFLSILNKLNPKGIVFLMYSKYDFVDNNSENSKELVQRRS